MTRVFPVRKTVFNLKNANIYGKLILWESGNSRFPGFPFKNKIEIISGVFGYVVYIS